MTWRSCSGATSGRAWRRWLGCPPRFLLGAGAGGRRLSEGGSEEGGLEELVAFLPSLSSRSATRRSKNGTSAHIAAFASGESVSRMGCGSGGCSFMPPIFCHHALEATTGRHRLRAQTTVVGAGVAGWKFRARRAPAVGVPPVEATIRVYRPLRPTCKARRPDASEGERSVRRSLSV